ncbi:Transcriptional regulatory protein sin3 [Mortierella hygrophila]|uniref:Transcriptional regulatory protein sin3 n=1 Tax=Mortierella hygrophila TaxID=979708 RepID=A0A9P6F963_9FUNG|nr:Transcriptional regulatory protein sin3 [Mortierella hygrophila]
MPAPPPEEKPQWSRGHGPQGYSSPSGSMQPHPSASPYSHHLPPVGGPQGQDQHAPSQGGPVLPPPPMSIVGGPPPRSGQPMPSSRPPTSPSLSSVHGGNAHPSAIMPPSHGPPQGHRVPDGPHHHMASSPQPNHMALSPHSVPPPHGQHSGPHMPSSINPSPPVNNPGPGPGPNSGSAPPPPPAQQTPPASGGNAAISPAAGSNYRPLNVRDALSYLDQVKVQFQDQPDVYNRFLDIMKDFKSQNIDTPGVIERVSTLFKGHPALISGFNTFLPPGYRIECLSSANETNLIRVTTPSGHTTTQMGGPIVIPERLPPPPAPSHYNQPPSYHMPQNNGYQPSIPPISQIQLPPVNAPGYMSQPATQPMGPSGSQNGANNKKTPVEFNHAINYVHKIKNRFSNDPETYKQFLELLQAYQKEMKPITDVYSHVTLLFKNAPDLLDEFKQFLPENGNPPNPDLFDEMMPQPSTPAPPPRSMPTLNTLSNGMAVGEFPSPPPSEMYTKKGTQIVPVPPMAGTSKKKRVTTINERPLPDGVIGTNKKRVKHSHTAENGGISPPMASTQPTVASKSPASVEELAFFDRVKRTLNNKQTYNEFLKLLNLFSQDILDRKLLVDRVETFLAPHKDLMDWFKAFVGWDGKDEVIENVAAPRHKVDLSTCRRYGESYRLLPKSETMLPCTGRDEMCWEVLNDVWASHPNWSVEGEGFMPHKKNQFEEALHRCEEERYEFDMNIEANLHTIALLEPIARQIQAMGIDERARFKLPEGLGGTSKTIYQRIIKKIYDNERGAEVIDALHNNPAISVPVVLKRLKQKDEEWKKSQRDWNKVWRELDNRNFYKALDHQGTSFKVADKRYITSKALVAEIEALRREQIDRRLVPSVRPRYQFQFHFKDANLFRDTNNLILAYLDRQHTFVSSDREKMESFIKEFVPQFFCLDDQFLSDGDVSMGGTDDQVPSTFDGSADRSRASGTGGKQGDAQVKMEPKDDSIPVSGPRVPVAADKEQPRANSPSNTWIQVGNYDVKPTSLGAAPVSAETKRSALNFFGNMTYYCFFRLYQLVYSRLETVKAAASELSKSASERKMANPAAIDLGLQDPDVDPEQTNVTGDPYGKVLANIHKVFDGEMDPTAFEEHARSVFATKAYIIFTMDKLIAALLKHVHTIVIDQRCNELIAMFVKDRQHEKNSRRQQIIYRMQADAVVGDESLYKIEYAKDELAMSIQLLSKNDYTLDTAISSEEKWGYYIDSYVLLTPTEGVLPSNFPTFLKRNLPEHIPDEPPQDIITHSGLEVKICINTYKIFFVNSTEDFFKRKGSSPSKEKLKEGRAKRLGKMDSWLKATFEDQESDPAEATQSCQKWFLEGPEDSQAGLQTSVSVVPGSEEEGTQEKKTYNTVSTTAAAVATEVSSSADVASTEAAIPAEATSTAPVAGAEENNEDKEAAVETDKDKDVVMAETDAA